MKMSYIIITIVKFISINSVTLSLCQCVSQDGMLQSYSVVLSYVEIGDELSFTECVLLMTNGTDTPCNSMTILSFH